MVESHKERAEDLIWLFYTVAILSAIALIAPVKWPGSSTWLGVTVLVFGALTPGAGGYMRMPEGEYGIANSAMNRPQRKFAKLPLARSHLLLNPQRVSRLQL